MQSANVAIGFPNAVAGVPTGFPETPQYFPERNYLILGVTRDATGVPLGGCTVRLFNAATNAQEQVAVSDAGGNYSFVVDKTQGWYAVAYLTGVPDVAGTTVNPLAAA